MVKKKKIRNINRIDPIDEIDQIANIKNMMECVRTCYLYHKKGCMDHVICTLDHKKLLNSVSFSKDKVPMDEIKTYLGNIYKYMDDVMDTISQYTLENNIETIHKPNLMISQPKINIFYLYQCTFSSANELQNIIHTFHIDKYDAIRFVVVKIGNIIFAYDISYIKDHLHIIKMISNICYKPCASCQRINDHANHILQCLKCGLVECSKCHKKCPKCDNKVR